MKRLNNKGFTIVEMIIAFSAFLFIVSFIPLSFRLFYQNGFVDDRLQRMEWEVFIGQAKKEIRMGERIRVENNRLTFVKNGQSITYEKYGTNIRRKVDLKGHEIMLQNIKEVTFEPIADGVRISVQDQFDQSESQIIRTMVMEKSLYAPK
jgi:competence protein ComGF